MHKAKEIICSEKLKPRKLAKSQNIVHRIFNRQHFGSKTDLSYLEFYQCIPLNLTVANIEKPACYLRKFSPCGKYLIAFSSDQASLEIYDFKGCSSAADLLGDWNEEVVVGTKDKPYEIRNKIFDKLFKVTQHNLLN
jgi:de-etiolated-1